MKFVLNGVEWRIKEVSQVEIKCLQNKRNGNHKENLKSVNDRYYGITYTDECIIYLDRHLKADRKRKTLLHELTHCYIASYMPHGEKEYTEEDVADIVSNSFDIINGISNEYLIKKGKKGLEELEELKRRLTNEKRKWK